MGKKLKVLVCAFACLGDPDKRFGQGGEGVLGWNLVKQLSRFFDVFVLTHSGNKELIEKEKAQNLKFFYLDFPFLNFFQNIPGGIQIYAYLWQIRACVLAYKLHRKIHFDVFHHLTYANDWMASFIGALLPIPYIRGPCGGAQKVPKNFLSEFPFKDRLFQHLRSIGQWVFRHDPFFIISQKKAKAILVCNKESFAKIPKKWQKKTYFFPVNGISKEDLDLLSRKKKKSENKFKVLSAGKLLPIKGFSLAIKAFKVFSGKVKNTELEIIGDGPELLPLKNLAQQLKIQEKIKFKKWLPRDEFLKELVDCDVFLFPSLRDGGGQVVIEAMAASKPVICLDLAGPGFHIKEEWGVKIKPTFPERAIKEIAKALEKLYTNESLRIQLGKRARERVENFYHLDKLGERLFKIYQEALD